MSAALLQLNFKYSISGDEYGKAASSMAPDFADVPGLRWKVWIINEAEQLAGGIYLFEDRKSLKTFLESPLAAQVMSIPALSDFDSKQFDVMDDPTTTTRGPVK